MINADNKKRKTYIYIIYIYKMRKENVNFILKKQKREICKLYTLQYVHEKAKGETKIL